MESFQVNQGEYFSVTSEDTDSKIEVNTGYVTIDGIDFELTLKSYSSASSDDIYLVEVMMNQTFSNVRFCLRIRDDSINEYKETENSSNPQPNVCLNSGSIYKILKSIFIEQNSTDSSCYDHGFVFNPIEFSSKKRIPEKVVKSRYIKRRKVEVSNYDNFLRCVNLSLNIRISVPQLDYLLKPFSLSFKFRKIVMLPIDPLPNELFIEIFRFLHSKYLLQTVNIVNKRFYSLVESEYLYQCHHFKLLGFEVGILTEKEPTQTWKDFVRKEFKNIIFWCCKKTFEDNFLIGPSNKRIVECVCDEYISFMEFITTTVYVPGTEHVQWKVKIGNLGKLPDKWTWGKIELSGFAVGIKSEGLSEGERLTEKSLGFGSTSCAFEYFRGNWYFGDEDYRSAEYKLNSMNDLRKKNEILATITLNDGKVTFELEVDENMKFTAISSFTLPKELKYCLAADIRKPLTYEIVSFKRIEK